MVYRFKMAFRAVWRRFEAGVVLKMSIWRFRKKDAETAGKSEIKGIFKA